MMLFDLDQLRRCYGIDLSLQKCPPRIVLEYRPCALYEKFVRDIRSSDLIL